ncbi:MAG: hypothetical protein ACUVXB_08580 [Bryobacteraceae bacterium]
MTDGSLSQDEVLARFQRLIRELLKGEIKRNTFQPWEIELLLDIESCNLRLPSRENVLRRWEKAVVRQLECGTAVLPMKLSEFLGRKP